MKKFLSFIALLLGIITATYSQDYKQIPGDPMTAPMTPELGKLLGQILYPVDYTNGLATVEIPIYEIKLKNLTIPVKLVYNSSGFKPKVLSEAGTGWVLSAEPYVAREVNGLPDEDYFYANWFKNTTELTQADRVEMAIGGKDGLPDRFFYNLPGKTGSFFTKRDFLDKSVKGFATVPHDPLKISAPDELKELTIVDTDGTEYNFISKEYTHRPFRNMSIFYTSVYKANTITTAQGDTVRFEYQNPVRTLIDRDKSETGSLEWLSWCQADDQFPIHECDRFGYAQQFNYLDNPCPPQGDINDYYYYRVKYIQSIPDKQTLYHVKRMGNSTEMLYKIADKYSSSSGSVETSTSFCSKIIFPGGTVEIVLDQIKPGVPASLGLRSITVKDSNGNMIRKAEFDMNYDVWQRLRLDKVRFVDNEGVTQEQYSMEYLGSIPCPQYDTWEVNSWGYHQSYNVPYRGLPHISTRFTMTVPYSNPLQTEEVYYRTETHQDYYITNPSQVSNATMLSSITYPTKGRSAFEYEPAKFRHSGREEVVYTGSLRIKSISNYLENGAFSGKRVFTYGTDNSGLGICVDEINDSDFITHTEMKTITNGSLNGYHTATRQIYQLHSLPFAGNSLSSSSSIVYDRVEERLENSTGNFEGKTEYMFDYSGANSTKDTRMGMTPYYYKRYLGWNYGQLREKNIYAATSSTQPVFKSTYQYISRYDIERIHGEAFYPAIDMDYGEHDLFQKIILATGQFPMMVTSVGLHFGSGVKLLSWQKDTEYTPDGTAVSKITEYNYNDNLLPVEIIVTGSDGIQDKTTYRYPTAQVALNRNIITPITGVDKYKGNEKIYSQDIEYGTVENNLYMPKVWTETHKEQSVPDIIRTYSLYNKYGRPLDASHNNNAYRSAYIWGNKGQHLVAEIKGTNYDVVKSTLGDALLDRVMSSAVPSTSDMNAINNLRTSFPGAQITTYEYKPLVGLISITAPDWTKTYFEYDTFNRLQKVQDGSKYIIEAYDYKYKNQ